MFCSMPWSAPALIAAWPDAASSSDDARGASSALVTIRMRLIPLSVRLDPDTGYRPIGGYAASEGGENRELSAGAPAGASGSGDGARRTARPQRPAQHRGALAGLLVEHRQQEAHRRRRNRRRVPVEARERRGEQAGDRVVVEADDRDVLGYPQAE